MAPLTRRSFSASAAAAPFLAAQGGQPRPNILWITCEDMGPHLRACGDEYSVTPNLDKFATRAAQYNNAWSNAPVCAPARTTIISGVYPPATGSEHMRSMTKMPDGWKMFPGYLRDAGYYTSNNSKEDYNLEKPPGTWDDSSAKAHWRNRGTGNQPFFSVFNHLISHESQIRTRPHTWEHDPAKARVPAYHPDTPEVRQDWAQYYDNITTMDKQAGHTLAELEKDGLAGDTVVLFFGDHGSGMPRSKRWPYNSGLNVCIFASIPEKFRHLAPKDYVAGKRNDRLISFVDLAPTMLSLAGVKAPGFYQGSAFLGPQEGAPRKHVFGFRGRMDERYDCVRTVRDSRYVYIRNYMPHKVYGQHLAYMWETPTTRVWERMYKEGKLTPEQSRFWQTKPSEELYDLETDRDEVKNLAESPAHRDALNALRKANREHLLQIKDVGLLPEAEIHERSGADAPYQMGHDAKRFPAERVLNAAELASSLKLNLTKTLAKMTEDPDAGVRYWGAMGILMRGQKETKSAHGTLTRLLGDKSPSVRIAAAEALGRHGEDADVQRAMAALIELANAAKNGAYVAMQAMNAIDALGPKAAPWKDRIQALPLADPNAPERVRSEYIKRLSEELLSKL